MNLKLVNFHNFEHFKRDITPIVTKSCKFSSSDLKFIEAEISRMTEEDIIEPSLSPWQSHV